MMVTDENEYLLGRIMQVCMAQCKPDNKLTSIPLTEELNKLIPNGFEAETYMKDKYTIGVKLKLPLFLPSIVITSEGKKELWYICTKKDLSLAYTVKDDEIIFWSDEEDVKMFLDWLMAGNEDVEVDL